MKNKIERIHIGDFVFGEDFIVVSKVAMTHDCTFVPYKEGMDTSGFMFVSETPFSDMVETVFQIKDHEIDFDLAITLGLGVVQNLHDKQYYLYNADTESDFFVQDETLKIRIYHQLVNPKYNDRELEHVINTKGMEEYLACMLIVKNPNPIKKLIQIFESKKGKGNNVIPLRSKFKKRCNKKYIKRRKVDC